MRGRDRETETGAETAAETEIEIETKTGDDESVRYDGPATSTRVRPTQLRKPIATASGRKQITGRRL